MITALGRRIDASRSSSQSKSWRNIHLYAIVTFGLTLAINEALYVTLVDERGDIGTTSAAFELKLILALLYSATLVYSYSVRGGIKRRVLASLVASFAAHALAIWLSATSVLAIDTRVAVCGAFIFSIASTSVALLSYLRRERSISLIAEGSSLQSLRSALPSCQIVATVAADPSDIDLLLVHERALTNPAWTSFIARAALGGCEVQPAAKFLRERTGRVPLDEVSSPSALSCQHAHYRRIKRIVDIGVVLLVMPFAAVVVAIASAAVMISMGRPVLFIQERVGLNGRIFKMYKIRTMHLRTAGEPQIATAKADARITPLGKFLRRYHIDELPQLWNVLIGDMTLIGPRPEQPNLVTTYNDILPGYSLRHLVSPGITGWSQVNFGYASTIEETREKLEYDLFYVEQYGPIIDATIAIRTLKVIFDPAHVR